MTIDTVDVKEFQITRRMVDDFRNSSKDDNDLHKRDGIVLGFQTAGLLRDFADEYVHGYKCTRQETDFLRPVPIDSFVGCYIKQQTCKIADRDAKEIVVGMKVKGREHPAAISTLTYEPQLFYDEDATATGKVYVLDQSDSEGIARGLGKEGADLSTLVFALSSNVLYKDAKKLVDMAAEKGLLPVYSRQIIHPHRPLDNGLAAGDTIYISTNAQEVADKAERHETKRRLFGTGRKLEESVYTADVIATTENKTIVYRANLRLAFTTKEALLKTA